MFRSVPEATVSHVRRNVCVDPLYTKIHYRLRHKHTINHPRMSSEGSTTCGSYNKPRDESADRLEAMERRIERLERDVRKASKRKIKNNMDLEVAPSMKAFDRCRELIHDFNKKNSVSSDPFTWGGRGCFQRIECATSLQSWLFTDAASSVGLDPCYCARFDVVDTGSELVTIDSHYRGGLGVSAFWIPSRKYDATPAADWATSAHKKRDPRRSYLDPRTGEAWTPHPMRKRPAELCEEYMLLQGS